MTFPNIPLSGGPRTLLDGLEAADDASIRALEALYEVMPFARDYATEADWRAAWLEHCGRCAALERIIDDLREIKGHLIMGGAR